MTELEELSNEINLTIDKYKDYVNKNFSKKEKLNKDNIENLLSRDIIKYPLIKNKEIFDSIYFVYKKIKNYLKENKNFSEIETLEYYLNYFKNVLLIPNIRYVIKEARRYRVSGIEIDDIISEGIIGLIEAFERYNPEKGCSFIFYESLWIKPRIRKAIEKSKIIEVPFYKQKKVNYIKRDRENLEKELCREPTIKELSDFTNIPIQKIHEIEDYNKNIVSLDTGNLKNYNGIKYRDNFEDKFVVYNLIEKLFRDTKMTKKERGILWDSTVIGKSLKEIGKDYNLTKERVRQIRNRGLKKIIIHNQKINTLEKIGMLNSKPKFHF
jgi:RNA polymerase primary sigma factor